MEGQDLSVMTKIWEDLAATEMRLEMMSELIRIKVGFADIEEFNLGLKVNLKNLTSSKISEIKDKKLVKVAMEVKMRDEQVTKRKLIRARNKARSETSKIARNEHKDLQNNNKGIQRCSTGQKGGVQGQV